MKKNLIISPCGASLFFNYARVSRNSALSSILRKNANMNEPEIPPDDIERLKTAESEIRRTLQESNIQKVSDLSSELNGIIRFYNGQISRNQDHHLLISTDTWLGRTSCRMVKDWLREKKLSAEILKQKDLQTGDMESFQTALSELAQKIEERADDYKKHEYNLIFNMTGGFKSIQGFLQTLAMFHNAESIYIFEGSDKLMIIPRLPVKIVADERIRENLTLARRLSMGMSANEPERLSETMIMKMDDETAFSSWGDIIWNRVKKEIYAEEIWPSPSPKVEYGQNFLNSVRNLPPKRKILINERIDDMARYMETRDENGVGYNPRSLDFKPLKGNPKPPNTHELDAWSDDAAKRIYGRFNDDVFVLERLDDAMH